jgi:hypothetical protein
MKLVPILAMAILLAYWPIGSQALTAQAVTVTESARTAPVSQPLVREGDFAFKLVEALHMGTTNNEAEAESMLSAAGIAPKNGWIADYPVTPDILMELQQDVARAADAGKLAIGKDEALADFQAGADDFGLYAQAGQPESQASGSPGSTERYVAPTVINNYYSDYGPPVVTYYPPPADYFYLYAWVPSPFWWFGFYYPGFYILHDFDRVVVFHGHDRFLTNHVFHHRTGRFFILDRHGRRFFDRDARHFNAAGRFHSRGFESPAARRGAESILRGRIEHSRGLRGVHRPGLRGGEFRGHELHAGGSHGAFRGRELHGGGSHGAFRGHGFPGGSRGAFRGHGFHEGRSPGALRGGFRGHAFQGGRAPGGFRSGFGGQFHHGGAYRGRFAGRGFHGGGFRGGFNHGGGFHSSFGGRGFRGGGFHGGGFHGGGFHGGGGFHHGGRR